MQLISKQQTGKRWSAQIPS